MKYGLPFRGFALLCLLGVGLLGACDTSTTGDPPPDYSPLTDVAELTPNVDSGGPVALEDAGDALGIVYTSIFGGSGDVYHISVTDGDDDGFYDQIAMTEEFPNENDSTIHYSRPDHHQFTQIGDYEIDDDMPSDPGNVYFTGPRHVYFDLHSDRVFYSMGYNLISQVASSVAPLDAGGGHTGEIVNSYDESLEDHSTSSGREPIWDFWYTKKFEGEDWRFTGGNHAAVSAPQFGSQWLAYADTLLESYDRDGDFAIGEDPVGEIEVLAGEASDFAPGIIGVDDDGDDLADFLDLEVAGIQEDSPTEYSYAWNLQNYLPAWDDDEDGLIDEDRRDYLDNDGDGLIDEDPQEAPIDDDGDEVADEDPPEDPIDDDADGLFDEDPIDGIDNDGDDLIDEDPPEDPIDDDGDGLFDEDPPEDPIDDDGDGQFDEDGLDFLDNDGDGRIDEDAEGDMNGDGFPGAEGDDDEDGFADELDPQVKHSNLRALLKDSYDPVRDDDEDGISDEDADYERNGIWVLKIGADGRPDESALPISLTNDGGRQPFFNPVGSDLIYVNDGDIYRLTLEFTADEVTVLGSENLTNTAAVLEAYPAYDDVGERIVFSSSQHGTSDIFIRQAGGDLVRVTNSRGQELYPRFTPDGSQILYEGWLYPDGNRRVMITVEELP
jgi:hypothetical protein